MSCYYLTKDSDEIHQCSHPIAAKRQPYIMFEDDTSPFVLGFNEDLSYGYLGLNIAENPEMINLFFKEQIELRNQFRLQELL